MRMTFREATTVALAEEMRRDAGSGPWARTCDAAALRPVPGTLRRVRPQTRRRRADLGGGDPRLRRRGGPRRNPAGRRHADLGLRLLRHGRAREPGREGTVHVRRAGDGAAGRPRADRHLARRRRPALAVDGGLVRPPARRGGRHSLDACRRSRAPEGQHSLRRSGGAMEHKTLWDLEDEVDLDHDDVAELGKAVVRAARATTSRRCVVRPRARVPRGRPHPRRAGRRGGGGRPAHAVAVGQGRRRGERLEDGPPAW